MGRPTAQRGMASKWFEAMNLQGTSQSSLSPGTRLDAPEQREERRNPSNNQREVRSLSSLFQLGPRERKDAQERRRPDVPRRSSVARFPREEDGVHDGAAEEGVDGRGDVGLDEEEEDLFVGYREEGRSDDG